MTKILAGHIAPDFTLPDTSGKTIALADALKRGPVVAAFYKVSCPVCQFTFPFLERIHQQFHSQAVTFLGISQDEAADTREFHKEFGVTFASLVDAHPYAVSQQFGLTNVPTVLLIEPDGKVAVSSVGFSKKDLLAIGKSLGERFAQPSWTVFTKSDIVPDYKPG